MPITELSQLDLNRRYTYRDYLSWQLEERIELIGGWIKKMSPAPNLYPQQISTNLLRILLAAKDRQPCRVFHAPFDVRLLRADESEATTVVQPDICVICDEGKLDERGCNGAPDWIIEILSPGNSKKEMSSKFKIYEDAGVREYWVIDPERRIVLRYVLQTDGHFVGLSPCAEDEPAASTIFTGLVIPGEKLFALR